MRGVWYHLRVVPVNICVVLLLISSFHFCTFLYYVFVVEHKLTFYLALQGCTPFYKVLCFPVQTISPNTFNLLLSTLLHWPVSPVLSSTYNTRGNRCYSSGNTATHISNFDLKALFLSVCVNPMHGLWIIPSGLLSLYMPDVAFSSGFQTHKKAFTGFSASNRHLDKQWLMEKDFSFTCPHTTWSNLTENGCHTRSCVVSMRWCSFWHLTKGQHRPLRGKKRRKKKVFMFVRVKRIEWVSEHIAACLFGKFLLRRIISEIRIWFACVVSTHRHTYITSQTHIQTHRHIGKYSKIFPLGQIKWNEIHVKCNWWPTHAMITIQIGSYLIDFMQIITFWEVWWDGNVNKKNNYSPKHYSVIVYYFPIKQTDLINNIASRAMNNININRSAAHINGRLFLMISTMSIQWHSVRNKRT